MNEQEMNIQDRIKEILDMHINDYGEIGVDGVNEKKMINDLTALIQESNREAELKLLADIKLGIMSNVNQHPSSAPVLKAVVDSLTDVEKLLSSRKKYE